MFVLKTFIEAIAGILHTGLSIYIWIIIIQAIISWVRPDPYNPIVQILNKLTIPVYNILRNRFNTVFSGVDIAPLIIILLLQFLDLFVVKLLYNFSATL